MLLSVTGPVSVEDAWPVDALIGVGTKEVALRLDERRGQPLGAQSVEVSQRTGEAGRWDPGGRRGGHNPAPAALTAHHSVSEVVVDQERRQIRIAVVGLPDPVKETDQDDAPTAPDRGERAEVYVSSVFRSAARMMS